jgi:hypothetical protein
MQDQGRRDHGSQSNSRGHAEAGGGVGPAAQAGRDRNCYQRPCGGGRHRDRDDLDYNDTGGDNPGADGPCRTTFIALIHFSCDIPSAKPLP